MTTTTIAATVGADWTPLVDGSEFSSCQLQVTTPQPLALAVATTEPVADADGFVIIINSAQPFVAFALETDETIWGRGFNGNASVRIIQVAAP